MRALAFLITALGLAACHQGEGDYCQVNSDCKGALVCNVATSTCQSTTGTTHNDGGAADAQPIDANTIDGPTVDAMPPTD